MDDKDELLKLRKLNDFVDEFERLDALIFGSIKSGNFDIIDQTLDAKKEIKRFLSTSKPIKVHSSLGQKIKKIRDNYGYAIDKVAEVLSKINGTTFSQESEDDIDYIDAFFSEGTADYIDEEFFTRRNEVSTLIVNESLPSHFVKHFQNLRECYALGLFQATIIYCRAVIETGCFEALQRRERKRVTGNDTREYSLKILMRSIKPYVYSGNWELADQVIKSADEILHSKRKDTVIKKNHAYDSIKDTFAIIEELFSGDHSKNKKR